ncbi:MAG: ester cyclase [Mycobacteriales bacterium]
MTDQTEANKFLVARLVNEVINGGKLDMIGQLYAPHLTTAARDWIASFRDAFPDVHMRTVQLVAEADTVVGRFTCTGTHRGTWRSHPPTSKRFTDIDEINLYHVRNGKITDTWNLEDNLERLTQLGLLPNHGQAET